MKVAILGLGYVGVVTAACLARNGHAVTGVDVNPLKVDLINKGRSPIVEAELDKLIPEAVESGRLRATGDIGEAIAGTDICFVCVGTPSKDNGDLDLTYVRRVCEQIGEALKDRQDRYTVVMRSTVLPGTNRRHVIALIEAASAKRAGEGFGFCSNPEFLREGSAVFDFDNPPKTVIGSLDEESAALLKELYAHLDAPMITTSVEIAELVKYADNAWHALKIGFANEIGTLCAAVGVDGRDVMNIFCQDEKLNISRSYLRPGFAFGGSCLPKDLRALNYAARRLDLELPVLGSVLAGNAAHLGRALDLVLGRGRGRQSVAVLGLSFKAGTDDLRESPMVHLVEQLIGKGYPLKIYDPGVSMAALMGANREYILHHIPHISGLLVGTLEEAVSAADIVLIGNDDKVYAGVADLLAAGQTVIDYAGLGGTYKEGVAYLGICW